MKLKPIQKMINIVQANLKRSKTANDLLTQLTYADLLIPNEQYQTRASTTCFSDKPSTPAIWMTNIDKMPVENHGAGDGYVWVKSGNIAFVNCCLTPHEHIKDFQTKFASIEEMLQDTEEGIDIAQDFNAKALEGAWSIWTPGAKK